MGCTPPGAQRDLRHPPPDCSVPTPACTPFPIPSFPLYQSRSTGPSGSNSGFASFCPLDGTRVTWAVTSPRKLNTVPPRPPLPVKPQTPVCVQPITVPRNQATAQQIRCLALTFTPAVLPRHLQNALQKGAAFLGGWLGGSVTSPASSLKPGAGCGGGFSVHLSEYGSGLPVSLNTWCSPRGSPRRPSRRYRLQHTPGCHPSVQIHGQVPARRAPDFSPLPAERQAFTRRFRDHVSPAAEGPRPSRTGRIHVGRDGLRSQPAGRQVSRGAVHAHTRLLTLLCSSY